MNGGLGGQYGGRSMQEVGAPGKEVRTMGDIEQHLSNLHAMLNSVADSVINLEERLQMVLMPTPPNRPPEVNHATTPAMTPLSGTLRDYTEQARNIRDKVDGIGERFPR